MKQEVKFITFYKFYVTVNVLEIDNGDKYIIGKGIVACVLANGQCSVVRSPLLSLNDVQALIKIAYYKAVNNIR